MEEEEKNWRRFLGKSSVGRTTLVHPCRRVAPETPTGCGCATVGGGGESKEEEMETEMGDEKIPDESEEKGKESKENVEMKRNIWCSFTSVPL